MNPNRKDDKNERGLFKRKDSPHWWIRYVDENGKLIRISTDTTSKTLAKGILAKKKTLVAEGKHLDIKRLPNTTFFELCAKYWEMHGQNLKTKGLLKLKEDGTPESGMIETWREGIGNIPLRALTQRKIEEFLMQRMKEKKLRPASYNRHLAMLKSMFNKAKEWGLLFNNPAALIKKLKEEGGRTRFFSPEEIAKLISGASETFRPLLTTALHTGMRRGELLNLKWVDVNFQNRIITVQQSKSGKKRMIPMDDTVVETLKDLPSRFKKGFVFPSSREGGGQLTDINKTFTRLTTKTKIEGARFHDTRHTFASHLVMAGVDLVTVQQLLGHASISMTMRYSHLAPEHRAKAVKVLDSAFSSATDTKTDTVENPQTEATASC